MALDMQSETTTGEWKEAGSEQGPHSPPQQTKYVKMASAYLAMLGVAMIGFVLGVYSGASVVADGYLLNTAVLGLLFVAGVWLWIAGVRRVMLAPDT